MKQAQVSRLPGGIAAIILLAGVAGCGGHGIEKIRIGRAAVPALLVLGSDLWAGTAEGLVRIPLKGEPPERFIWTGNPLSVSRVPAREPIKGDLKKAMESAASFNGIRAICAWKDGLALATGSGVFLFSPSRSSITAHWTTRDGLGADSVRSVTAIRGRLWASTIFGASRLDANGRRWRNYSDKNGLASRHVYCMADDGKDIWASCINGGLARFSASGDRWEPVPQENGLGNKYIYALLPGEQGIWMGTRGGVNLLNPRHHWDEAVCTDDYTEYCVYSLALTGEDLWFGTAFGLFRRNLKSGRQAMLTSSNGLPSDEVVAMVAEGGRLWMGTTRGLARKNIGK